MQFLGGFPSGHVTFVTGPTIDFGLLIDGVLKSDVVPNHGLVKRQHAVTRDFSKLTLDRRWRSTLDVFNDDAWLWAVYNIATKRAMVSGLIVVFYFSCIIIVLYITAQFKGIMNLFLIKLLRREMCWCDFASKESLSRLANKIYMFYSCSTYITM